MAHQTRTCHHWALGLLALIASGLGAAAQPSGDGAAAWTPYGPPAGQILDLAVGSAGQLFLAAELSGVYASRDGGGTWSWSGAGMGSQRARALAVDAATGSLYAVGDGRLFRSTDSGTSWQALSPNLPLDPPPQGGDVLALAPGEPTTFYLARGARLFRGSDGGAFWEEVLDTPSRINALLIDPRNPLSVFAGPTEPPEAYPLAVPWHSADGGSSWSPLNATFDPLPGGLQGPPYFYGTKQLAASPGSRGALFAVFQYAASVLYRSLDGGATWHLTAAPPGSDGFVSSVAAPAALRTLYVVAGLTGPGYAGLFASQDLGDTWVRVDRDGVPPDTLRFDPATGDFYGPTEFGVARGENGGAHWRRLLVDKDTCGGDDPVQQDPLLYRSSDGGHSWSTLPIAANVIAIDPRTPATLYALGPTGLSRSTDDGATWQKISDFNLTVDYFQSPTGGDLLVDPSNSRHLWAARPDGVWQSLDGGVTWHQRSKGLRGAAALSLFIDPHQPGKLEVATSEGLFQTRLP